MSDFAEAVNAGADQISEMKGIAQANNAWSAEQASIQRDWQEKQNAKAMAFNQDEAAKNRDWQEMLSNTAHQREVRDLMAAGLNPVLSAMNGNGASVGSGATAQGVTSSGAKGDTDTSANGAIANLLGSILSAQTQIEAANINAKTQEAVADKYTAMEKIVSEIQASASRYGSDKSAEASKYGSDKRFTSDMAGIAESAAAAAGRIMADKSIASGHDAAQVAAAAARRPDTSYTYIEGDKNSTRNNYYSKSGSSSSKSFDSSDYHFSGKGGFGSGRKSTKFYEDSAGHTFYFDSYGNRKYLK